MRLTFAVEGDDTSYAAKVIASEEGIDASTRNLRVRALVSNEGTPLKTGAFARVTLDLGTDSTALMVPTQAVIPQERDKMVIRVKEGIAQMRTITTGVRRESLVEVTSGLAKGDTVLTTGILFVRDGMPVKISGLVQ
jgi:RND family efflux transporter, MFP subunit